MRKIAAWSLFALIALIPVAKCADGAERDPSGSDDAGSVHDTAPLRLFRISAADVLPDVGIMGDHLLVKPSGEAVSWDEYHEWRRHRMYGRSSGGEKYRGWHQASRNVEIGVHQNRGYAKESND